MSVEKETGRYKAYVMANPLISSFLHFILGGCVVYLFALFGIL